MHSSRHMVANRNGDRRPDAASDMATAARHYLRRSLHTQDMPESASVGSVLPSARDSVASCDAKRHRMRAVAGTDDVPRSTLPPLGW